MSRPSSRIWVTDSLVLCDRRLKYLEAVKKSRAARVAGVPPATLRAGGGCGAISLSLVVNDVTTSPPPRSSISPRKLHQRGPLWISSQPLRAQGAGHRKPATVDCDSTHLRPAPCALCPNER